MKRIFTIIMIGILLVGCAKTDFLLLLLLQIMIVMIQNLKSMSYLKDWLTM